MDPLLFLAGSAWLIGIALLTSPRTAFVSALLLIGALIALACGTAGLAGASLQKACATFVAGNMTVLGPWAIWRSGVFHPPPAKVYPVILIIGVVACVVAFAAACTIPQWVVR